MGSKSCCIGNAWWFSSLPDCWSEYMLIVYLVIPESAVLPIGTVIGPYSIT